MVQFNFPNYGTITVSLATVNDLATFPPTKIIDGLHALVAGQATPDDGLGGIFTWDGTSTATADDTYIIPAPGLSVGRWVKTVRADSNLRTDLSADAGSSLVGYKNTGLLPVIRSVAARNQLEVYGSDYQGFDAGGGTSSRDAILRAADALPNGGTILISAREAVLVDTDMELPSNVTLRGPLMSPGLKKDNLHPTAFHTLGGRLVINPNATFKVGGGGGVSGLVIQPKGMTFPQTTTAGFGGTAITINGDDTLVERCCILGFNQAIISSGYARQRIEHNQLDNVNGIDISNCADVAHIVSNHAWPWATIQPNADWRNLWRNGTAFYIHDTCDHAKLIGNFGFGYMIGAHLKNVNAVLMMGTTFDNLTENGVTLVTGSKGLVVEGYTARVRVIGFQSSGMDSACAEINVLQGQVVTIEGEAWTSGHAGCAYRIASGDALISGSINQHTTGIEIGNANSKVRLADNFRFDDVTNMINAVVPTTNLIMGTPQFAETIPDGKLFGAGSVTAKSIASASLVSLPLNGDVFHITGTTSFGSLEGGWAGRKVTLIIDGALTVYNSTGSFNAMKLASNFATSGPNSLSLVHDGVQWFETGRS